MEINFSDYSENDSNWINRKIAESCEKRNIVFDVIDNFAVCSQQYLNVTDTEYIERITSIVKNLIDYACIDNGNMIINLRSFDYVTCVSKTRNEGSACSDPYENKFEKAPLIYMMRHMRDNQCDEKREAGKSIGNCVATVVRTCSDMVGSVLQKIMDVTYDEFTCDS